jgi:1,4-alpha-glucan branching enzyme
LRPIVVSEYISGDVEFCFYRHEAREVFLCGDFNGWDRRALPMARMDGAWWKCRLRLAPGSYQFKYLADGEWCLDYAAFGIERGPLGAWNSVILVRSGPGDAEPRRAPVADIVMPSLPPQVILRPRAGVRGLRRCPV